MMPLAVTMLLAADLAAPAWKPGVPLMRDGAQLTYDGQPFAAVGVNKHELLEQYLAKEIRGGDQEATAARTAAKRSLELLSEAGITVLRFRACPFWPTWLQRTFRSEDAAVRAASWAAFDEMLDDCDRSGIRVIPSLAWNLAVFPDLANESLRDLVANPDSRSRALLREWSEEVVGRYRNRDTVLFWELGNEWNLYCDLRPQYAEKGVFEGIDPTPAPDPILEAPRVTVLHANVPNPFNPTTKIAFDLAHAGPVKLQIFDVAGHVVKTLVDGTTPAGRHEAAWAGLDQAGRRAASGVYFYQLVTDDFSQTRKMALLK